MDAATFPEIQLNTHQPLQHQLHKLLVGWISSGRLPAGIRLPASRQLAELANVSRNTVTAVVDQLKAEGFVQSHVGKGCFVSSELPTLEVGTEVDNQAQCWPPLSNYAQRLQSAAVPGHTQVLPFTPGIPDLAQFPLKLWQKIQRCHHDRTRLMGYHDPQGYRPLREALSTYLQVSRGVRCGADQILITQGAQQAISLCSQLLLNKGDTVMHENPGYRGASAAFKAQQPNLLYVPLVNQVLDVEGVLANRKHYQQAKLLYCCPTHQYPMGGLLSASQRLALLAWARDNKTWIIEDDYDSEFYFQHKPVAAMQGFSRNNNVLYMGSFSKTLFPALRLGYLVLPKPLVASFVAAKSFSTGESNLLNQAIVTDFIQEGHFGRHLRRMRLLYQQKWQHFESILRAQLPAYVRIVAESAGMHLAIEIPNIDDQQLKRDLLNAGFGSSALSTYYEQAPVKTGLVLGFANSSEAQRQALVSFLKVWLDQQIKAGRQ